MARTRDMTAGSPTKHLILFTLPIIAGNAFQQLYSLVDSFVVGQVSVDALTAVASAGWLDWLVLSLATGLAQGFGIQVAQSFGAGDVRELRQAVGQSLLLSAATVVTVELLAQLLLWPVLNLLDTPAQIIRMTERYLRIIFAGLPLVMGFNLLAGFLRSVGNSRTPLIAMTSAALCNIALDILFVAGFGWGVVGVATATVISQGISCIICLVSVLRLPILRISRSHLRLTRDVTGRLMRLGIPISFQNFIISVGGLVLQGVVNAQGFIFMAGYSAAGRLQGLIELAGTALSAAVGTFTGQNIGARKLDRVKLGLRKSVQIAAVLALIMGSIVLIWGKPMLKLFIEDDPAIVEQVLTYGYRFLIFMGSGLIALYMLFVYRSTLQGLGDTFIPMISGIVELFMRIGGALLLPLLIGEWGIYLAEIMAWIGAAVLLIWGYYKRIRNMSITM